MATKVETVVQIKEPRIQRLIINIEGTAPLCINRFSNKALEQMIAAQEAGASKKSKKEREPKDFEALYEAAKHVSDEGWCGIHAAAFRNGMISACKAVGYVMTRAKLAVTVDADGFDREDGAPLVRITKGEPEMWVTPVRISGTTCDVRSRPLWREWGASVRVAFDADMFHEADVVNLMARVGLQVGIGEGRPDSKSGCGLGFGLFRLVNG